MSSDSAPVTYHTISRDQLVDYALGTLEPATSQYIEDHLAEGCPECEKQLDRLNRVLEATRSDVPPHPPSYMVHRAKQLFVHHHVETVPRQDRVAAFLMDSRTVVSVIALTAILFVGLGGAYLWHRIPTARMASLGVIASQVEVRRTPDGEWTSAGDGTQLGTGMALRTGHSGTVEATFPDQSTLTLGESTWIHINTLYTLTSVGPQIAQLQQSQGYGQYQISGGAPGGGFTVSTPLADIQGRDTRYDLTVSEDGTTAVAVHDGSVSVSAGEQNVDVPAGQILVISPTAPEIPLEPVPLPPTITPTPTLTATDTPRAPAIAPVRATETPSPTPTATDTQRPYQPPPPATATLTATPTPTPSPTATATPTITPSPTVTPTATPVPPTPVPPSPTPVPPSPTPVPPTPTPVPPTNTAAPPTATWTPKPPTPKPATPTPTPKATDPVKPPAKPTNTIIPSP